MKPIETMECPRCAERVGLERLRGVEVARCPRCGGLFLDRGELNRVAEPNDGDLEFSTLSGDDHAHPDDRYPPILCPRGDGAWMEKVEFNVHTGIILDHCPSCGGFWVDGPELEKIDVEVRRLDEESRDVPDPPMLWFVRFLWSLPFR